MIRAVRDLSTVTVTVTAQLLLSYDTNVGRSAGQFVSLHLLANENNYEKDSMQENNCIEVGFTWFRLKLNESYIKTKFYSCS